MTKQAKRETKDPTSAFDAMIRDLGRPARPPTWQNRLRSAGEWLFLAFMAVMAAILAIGGIVLFVGIIIAVTSPLWAIGLLALWFVGLV